MIELMRSDAGDLSMVLIEGAEFIGFNKTDIIEIRGLDDMGDGSFHCVCSEHYLLNEFALALAAFRERATSPNPFKASKWARKLADVIKAR